MPSNSASATDYYLSPTGNDAGLGTAQAAPWKTFAHSLPKLNPGDTLNLLNGIYQPGTGTRFPNIDCSSGTHNGTAGNPITLRAVNERQAWIKGDGSVEPFHLFNCSYWNIIGLHISDGDFATEVTFDGAMNMTGDSDLLIERNILEVLKCKS